MGTFKALVLFIGLALLGQYNSMILIPDYTDSHIYRAWDARFNLSGAKLIPNETPIFKSLLESIYIPYVS